MRKVRFPGVKRLALSHTVMEGNSQDLNPLLLDSTTQALPTMPPRRPGVGFCLLPVRLSCRALTQAPVSCMSTGSSPNDPETWVLPFRPFYRGGI